MRLYAPLVVFGVGAVVVVFAACAETATIPGVDGQDSGPAADGATFTVGTAPQEDGGRDASLPDAASDAGEDASVGGLTCAELGAAYAAALSEARTCNPTATVNECTVARERFLGCGCDTFLNANRVSQVDRIVAQWQKKSCAVLVCPAVACLLAESGKCQANGVAGSCVDVVVK